MRCAYAWQQIVADAITSEQMLGKVLLEVMRACSRDREIEGAGSHSSVTMSACGIRANDESATDT